MEVTQRLAPPLLRIVKLLGIKQGVLAAKLGVSSSVVSQWKSGVRPIPAPHLHAIVDLIREALPQDRSHEALIGAARDLQQALTAWLEGGA